MNVVVGPSKRFYAAKATQARSSHVFDDAIRTFESGNPRRVACKCRRFSGARSADGDEKGLVIRPRLLTARTAQCRACRDVAAQFRSRREVDLLPLDGVAARQAPAHLPEQPG